MPEVKYRTDHHAGATPEARIANRLKNSGGEGADHSVVHGTGPTRTHTNIHHAANARQQGKGNPGEDQWQQAWSDLMTPAEFKQQLAAGYREALEATAKEFGVSVEECAKVICERMSGRVPRDIAPNVLAEMEAACPTDVLKDIVRRGVIPGPSTAGAGGTVSSVRINPGLPGTVNNGWRNSMPIGPPPGVALCDAMMDAQDQRDRVELAERIAKQKLAAGA
jgi:hypothetical protein